MPGADGPAVARYRRRRKEKLVQYFGNCCHDCGGTFPPFVYDFDHREPSKKSFNLGNYGNTVSWEKTLVEAEKCDMVCSNCHRLRTHKQRCPGCGYCDLP